MKLIISFNRGLLCSILLACLMLLSLSMEAQNSFVKPGKTANKNTSSSKNNTSSKATPATFPNKATRTIDSKQKGTLLHFSLLSLNENGYIMLDMGNGAEILKNQYDKPFTSIIGALNYMVGIKKWRLVNSYDLTNENPFPSFLLNKHLPEG